MPLLCVHCCLLTYREGNNVNGVVGAKEGVGQGGARRVASMSLSVARSVPRMPMGCGRLDSTLRLSCPPRPALPPPPQTQWPDLGCRGSLGLGSGCRDLCGIWKTKKRE